MGFSEVDVEVDPLALGREFEFFVAADIGEVRADEDLGDVPVPQPESLGRRAWVRPEVQLFVGADEEEVEVVWGPAGANFGSVTWARFAESALFKRDRLGGLPEGKSGIGAERN